MRKTTAFAGLGLAAALVLTGCSATAEEPMDESMSEEPAVVDTVNSDGAALRAQLTALLADHVYLAGAAIDQALADGGDLETADVQAAVATVDENSKFASSRPHRAPAVHQRGGSLGEVRRQLEGEAGAGIEEH